MKINHKTGWVNVFTKKCVFFKYLQNQTQGRPHHYTFRFIILGFRAPNVPSQLGMCWPNTKQVGFKAIHVPFGLARPT